MRRDPLGYVDGPSMYSYVNGHPQGNVDPFGLWCWDGWRVRAEKGDTLWGLAQILFGDGSRWSDLGYSGSPGSLQIGEWVDLSKWVDRYVTTITNYETLVTRHNNVLEAILSDPGLIDAAAAAELAAASGDAALMQYINGLGWTHSVAADISRGLEQISDVLKMDARAGTISWDAYIEHATRSVAIGTGADVLGRVLTVADVLALVQAYDSGDYGAMVQSGSSLLLGGARTLGSRVGTGMAGGPWGGAAAFVVSGAAIGIELVPEYQKFGYYARERIAAQQGGVAAASRLRGERRAMAHEYLNARAMIAKFRPFSNLVGPPVSDPDPTLFTPPSPGGSGIY